MRGHFEDDGCGGEKFIPYRESEDEAYERWRDRQAEDRDYTIRKEVQEVMAQYREFTSVKIDRKEGL